MVSAALGAFGVDFRGIPTFLTYLKRVVIFILNEFYMTGVIEVHNFNGGNFFWRGEGVIIFFLNFTPLPP